MAYTTEDIRNIALVGHAGAGKTELNEALLHAAGKIANRGSVDNGDTVSDFDPRERELKHSLHATFCHLDHGGVHVNLVDTPGYPDFQGRTLSVLPAVETVAVVVDAGAGVEPMTQQFMESAEAQGLCRMIVVNKIDAADADTVVEQIQEAFGSQCLPINLPAEGGTKVVDVFFEANGADPDFGSAESAHEQIVDQVVEVDDELMELYLEQGEVAPDQLHEPFEKALREGHLVPICFASATTGAGVPDLLDIFERFMPNPKEGNPPPFVEGEGEDAPLAPITPDPALHAVAHVVKVDIDPFRGRMATVRSHQGTVRRGGHIFIGGGRKPFKIGHLLKLNGAEQSEVEAAIPGDICAIPRAEDMRFDAVLHDARGEYGIHMRSMPLPEPMYGRAIAAESDAEAQKVNEAVSMLCAEDPSLRLEQIASMNETVLRGIGELHLRITLDEVADKYGIAVKTSLPSIAYRETIMGKAEGHHRHKKQTGGAGQFGEVFLRVEPLPRGEGFEFVNGVVGGVIPSQFIPAVEKGVREVIVDGAISGHPLQDVRVTVHDGKHHSVDSKEVAFVQAGKRAFIDAVRAARPIVMEPIVDITVTVPDYCMGDVAGDLSSMRGSIKGTNGLSGGRAEISGQAPLKEVQGYHSRLKSLSGGEGTFSMAFSHYAQMPATDQAALVSAFRHEDD